MASSNLAGELPHSFRVDFLSKDTEMNLSYFASIVEVVELFGLNKEQKLALCILGKELLRRFQPDGNYLPSTSSQQEALFMYGMGGSGRSYVIHAWKALAKSWNREGTVKTMAISGVAAFVVDGITVASITTFMKASNTKRISHDKKEEWQGVKFIILDEISMAGAEDVEKLSNFFKQVTDIELSFGGLLVCLCGDFAQLSPVRKASLSREGTNHPGKLIFENIRSKNTVVLNQIMRTAFLEYIQLQENVRLT